MPDLLLRRSLLALGLAAAAAAGPAVLPLAAGAAEPTAAPTKACTYVDKRLPGIAAMASSTRHPGVLWVHSTERYTPKIYALDTATCAIRATLTLKDASGREITGMAMSRDNKGRPVIVVGDVGDSLDARPYVRIHEVLEPRALVDRTVAVRTWRVKYPDGPRNAQTILATPKGSRLWIVTAQTLGGKVFAVPPLTDIADGETDGIPLKAKPVGEVSGLITDGAVSPGGTRTVLRTATDARLFGSPPPKGSGTPQPMPKVGAGQAVAWSTDGKFLWSSGAHTTTLWKVPVAATAPVPGSSPRPSASATPARSGDGGPSPKRLLLAGAAVLVAVGVAWAASWRFRV